jgi:outer membrane lipase/esterase
MTRSFRSRISLALYFATTVAAGTAYAKPSELVIFGDSLADTGNNAALIDLGVFGSPPAPPGSRTSTPIANSAFIPTLPYSSNRYSNGPVWTDQFAASLGLSATNSLSPTGGTNFAFGGARITGGPVPSLTDQVGIFLGKTGGVAPSTALYVVEGGGNDARDILETAAGGGDPAPLISAYAQHVGSLLSRLEGAGARDILLADVPDLGKLPAVTVFGATTSGLASLLTGQMNDALFAELAHTPAGVDIHVLDFYGLLDKITQHPGDFGLTNVTTACAADAACIANPAGTFFWDGIHATTEGAGLISNAALAAVPEPSTVTLLFLGSVAVLVLSRRRKPS